jgi:dolichol-phosphate mannosyltransferase
MRPRARDVEISVVIPVFGCGDCLWPLHQRLTAALREITSSYELVLIDDRSPDYAWQVLLQLAEADPAVRPFRLSRNFGQHAAITAGLAQSRGQWTVVMDCDLQDPPEEIPRLYAKAQEGYDVVLSRRHARQQSMPRRWAGALYYVLRNRLVGTAMHTNYTNLSIISRKVVDAFLALRDKDRQYLLILDWLGFYRAEIEVHQEGRLAGRSSYKFIQLLRVAVDGMFFQTTRLLRWIVYTGFLMALIGALLAFYALGSWATGGSLPRWTALPVLILLLTGFIIISTGVTGLYVGKIFEQVKGRPLYVIDTEVVDGVERAPLRELGEPITEDEVARDAVTAAASELTPGELAL